MMRGSYVVERPAADLLTVGLSGTLDATLLSRCEADVRTRLSVVKQGDVRVLVDLSAVTHYSLESRDMLTALQTLIGRKASQTAYAATQSEGRSLALWVSHMSGPQVIRSFGAVELALAWLGGTETVQTGVRPLARARRPRESNTKKLFG